MKKKTNTPRNVRGVRLTVSGEPDMRYNENKILRDLENYSGEVIFTPPQADPDELELYEEILRYSPRPETPKAEKPKPKPAPGKGRRAARPGFSAPAKKQPGKAKPGKKPTVKRKPAGSKVMKRRGVKRKAVLKPFVVRVFDHSLIQQIVFFSEEGGHKDIFIRYYGQVIETDIFTLMSLADELGKDFYPFARSHGTLSPFVVFKVEVDPITNRVTLNYDSTLLIGLDEDAEDEFDISQYFFNHY